MSQLPFPEILCRLEAAGYASYDIAWAEALTLPTNADEFASELIYVICNSGMRFTVARQIYDRIMPALRRGGSSNEVFRHKGKCRAIDDLWREQDRRFAEFLAADDKIEYLGDISWIGNITKYHAAKNFGVDCVKPDVHLARLAVVLGTTPHELCQQIATETGYRIGTIDTLIWRACALGILNSRTGKLSEPHPERSA